MWGNNTHLNQQTGKSDQIFQDEMTTSAVRSKLYIKEFWVWPSPLGGFHGGSLYYAVLQSAKNTGMPAVAEALLQSERIDRLYLQHREKKDLIDI